jgi:2-hydroxy-3-keto-5-methylthiopentenyl-1-phosphate phosphatase
VPVRVFCDFDGTITEHDTLLAVCQHFIPELAAQVCPAIGRGELTLRAGLSRLIGALPSAAANEIREFVCRQPIRRGFPQFLHYLHARQVPFTVLSSGLDFCVHACLSPWQTLIHSIHALQIDLGGEYMAPVMAGGHCSDAVPKAGIMLGYPAEIRIVIGDSLSDREMALHADRLFARDRLLRFAQEHELPARRYENFLDVLGELDAMGHWTPCPKAHRSGIIALPSYRTVP